MKQCVNAEETMAKAVAYSPADRRLLIPTPKYLQMFSCVINDPSRLESLIDAVQTLVLQEIFNGNGGLLKKYPSVPLIT